MNGIFNVPINTQSTNMFGAVGSQAPLLSSSSSTASTNSDHQLDTLLWLNGVSSTSKSYSPPADHSDFQGVPPFGASTDNRYSNACGNCEGVSPENHCFDCGDSLCNRCVILHLRHFHYKHHTIQKIRNGASPPSGNRGIVFANSPSPRIDMDNQCDMHYEMLRYVCEHCKIIVCQECTLRDHKDHQCTSIDAYTERPMMVIQMLMDKGAAGKQQIKQNIDRILQFSQHLDRDTNDLVQRTRKNGIRNATNNATYRSEDVAADKGVVEIIEKFRQQKLTLFHDQTSGLRAALAGIASVTDDLKKFSITFHDLTQFQLTKTLIEADHKIEHFLKQTRKLAPSPVNINHFMQSLEIGSSNLYNISRLLQPNSGILPPGIASLPGANVTMGLITNNNAPKSLRRPIVRSNRNYQNNNPVQQPPMMQTTTTLNGINNWNVAMPTIDIAAAINGFRDGFNISPPRIGAHLGSSPEEPRAYGQCIFNSDSPVTAIQRIQPSVSFAFDGSLDGQLSRPWGVCVDKDSNIIVGDRRNNRIQVFYPDGQFKFAFGTKGSGDGQMELPAGVTTDRQNRIIVADKDNHRIQIFSSTGRFILKFGGYGRDLGEFQYPWDVAVNSVGNILATDTRNHRIQMFTSVGHFITKYSFDNAYYEKHLKSHITPRGICFTPNGDILVTDFENHRIMKLDGNLTMVSVGATMNEISSISYDQLLILILCTYYRSKWFAVVKVKANCMNSTGHPVCAVTITDALWLPIRRINAFSFTISNWNCSGWCVPTQSSAFYFININ